MADHDIRLALANPITRARVDSLIDDFRARGVPLHPLNILTYVADELGLCTEMAVLLVQAVEARLEELEQARTA